MLQEKEVVKMGTISLRLSDEDDKLVRAYAKLHKKALSSLFTKALIEKIEDEMDLKLFEKAIKESKGSKRYTHEEVMKEFGL